MEHLKALKEKAEKDVARQKALSDLIAAENRDFTEAEKKEFDELSASIDATLAKIDTAKAVADREARVAATTLPVARAKDVTGVVDKITQPTHSVPAEPAKKLSPIEIIGIGGWAALASKVLNKPALKLLEDKGLTQLAETFRKAQFDAMQEKTWTTASGAAGDNLIFTPLSTDFIPYLYNASAYLSGGPMQVDMPYGSLKIPGGNASLAGSYSTENGDPGYSEGTTRQVSMSAKHLKVVTAFGNYVAEVSPLAIAQIIGQDMSNSLTVSLDAAGLRGSGSGSNPNGILNLVNASFKSPAATINGAAFVAPKAPTVAEIENVAGKVLASFRATNIPMIRTRWIMSNRVYTYLQFLRTSLGPYAFPGLQIDNPTWIDGIPVTRTEQVPNNLSDGTNSDCSEIYLVSFGHAMMGVTRQLRMQASQEASYVNGSSTLVSAFSRDETVIRAIASHDFNLRYDKSAYVITQVRWGA